MNSATYASWRNQIVWIILCASLVKTIWAIALCHSLVEISFWIVAFVFHQLEVWLGEFPLCVSVLEIQKCDSPVCSLSGIRFWEPPLYSLSQNQIYMQCFVLPKWNTNLGGQSLCFLGNRLNLGIHHLVFA